MSARLDGSGEKEIVAGNLSDPGNEQNTVIICMDNHWERARLDCFEVSLSDSSVPTIKNSLSVKFKLYHSADLAVDWLNDRLYWVDRNLRQIGEYDLHTRHRSIVITTGAPGSSHPAALVLFPYPNYGLVFTDIGNRVH